VTYFIFKYNYYSNN